jgi:hypothetical protein
LRRTQFLVLIPWLLAAGSWADAQEAVPTQEPVPSPTPAPVEAPPSPPPPVYPAPPPGSSGQSQASNYFNPSVSVIGNFLGVAGHNPVENLPAASLRESEVALQAIVDPYGRADFFLSFSEQGVEVEEGFLTLTSLPWKLLVKAGRMRVSFGKINTLHLHVLPWPDSPLPIVNLLGGEEGWKGTGVSVARLLPLPGDTFSEVTLQVFDGHADNLFDAPNRGNLSYNGHYRIFKDLSEAVNVDLGASYGAGANPTSTTNDVQWTTLAGADLTLRWKPLMTGNYHAFILRGEFIHSDRREPLGDQRGYGWFGSAEYQFAKRWWVGARVEASDHADDSRLRDKGQAVTLTFNPSEFSQIRTELRRRVYGGTNVTATEALFQLQFAIGAHGAHPF